MKDSFFSRKIDELGRIVIPVEIRRSLHFKEGDSLVFNIDNDSLTLRKQTYVKDRISTIKNLCNDIASVIDGNYFITDREKIIISSNSKISGALLNDTLLSLLNVNDKTTIDSNFLKEYNIQTCCFVFPYYINNVIEGLFCLYDISSIDKYIKLVSFITLYIHNILSI